MSILCNDDCIALFTKYNVKTAKNSTLIIEGKYDYGNELQKNLIQPRSLQANNIKQNSKDTLQIKGIMQNDKTKDIFAQYILNTLSSPTIESLPDLIKNHHFNSWSKLISTMIQIY